MLSNGTTNALLLVIALALTAITTKLFLLDAVPTASAQENAPNNFVRLMGCVPVARGGCNYIPVRVDANGYVQVVVRTTR